jgi:hypothetical protein
VEHWEREIAELAALFRRLRSARGYDHPLRRIRRKQAALKLGLTFRQALAEYPAQQEAITLALLRALGLDEEEAPLKPASWRRF